MGHRARSLLVWNHTHLHEHLQGVVDLELWTIPYYLTVMSSIKDPASDAYRLIQTVVHQEMLHAQLASNIANAYGLRPRFTTPTYAGAAVPHINFALDEPNPTDLFHPYSAELGPLDDTRINTMCLIEYPEWQTQRQPDLREDQEEYGSIGEFYDAVRDGMRELRHLVRGGINQIEHFGGFYPDLAPLTITADGDAGFRQASALVDVITDQGEGQTEAVETVPVEMQNTADGMQESWPHYKKFEFIRQSSARPATYTGVRDPEPGTPGHQAQQILIRDFAAFLATLTEMFSGGQQSSVAFGVQMAKLGGDVLTCWHRNAIPKFS